MKYLQPFLGMVACFGFLASANAEVPTARLISPSGLQRGTSVEVEITGDELADVHQVLFYSPGLEAKDIKAVDNKKLKLTVVASEDADCDLHAFRLIAKNGISNLRLLGVSALPNAAEAEPNNSFSEPQLVPLNSTINGTIQPEDADFYVVEAPQGEMISVELEGLRHNYLNNMFDPFVAIYDGQGKKLAASDDAVLVQQDCICGVIAPESGRYLIEVRDSSYLGNRDSVYRLHVGNFARPIAMYPSGGRPGEKLTTTCVDSMGNTWEETFQLPSEPMPKFKVWSTRGKVPPPSPNALRVSSYENVLEVEPNEKFESLQVTESFPVAFNGCLQSPGDQDWFVFAAKKGQALEFRLVARNVIRSPVDGVVEIHKFKGGRLSSSDDAAGPDSAISFKAPEDGKYAVCVKNHMNFGGSPYVYRLEVEPPTPKLVTTVKEQERYMSQTIPIPRGGRMAVDVLIDRKFVSGDTEVIIPDLPPGVEQVKAIASENSNHVQLILRAKPDAPLQGKLVDLSARIKNEAKKIDVTGHMDQRTQIVRGQNNRDVWGINSDKLAIAVVDAVGFELEVVQPQVPLVRDGTYPLIVRCKRAEGFTKAIRLKVLEPPPGVTASTSISIPEGKNEVELPLTANSKAAIGHWPLTVIGSTRIGNNSTVTLASEFIDIEVADRLFDFQFNKTIAELGSPAKVNVGVNLLRPIDGKVEVEVVGLPPNTKMEKPKLPVTANTKHLSFVLSIPPDARPGVFKTIACRGTVTSDKGVITQVNGTGEVQIEKPSGDAKAGSANAAGDDKPLTRLEELRKQREESKTTK